MIVDIIVATISSGGTGYEKKRPGMSMKDCDRGTYWELTMLIVVMTRLR